MTVSGAAARARLILPSLAAVPASDPSDVFTALAEAGRFDLSARDSRELFDALRDRLARLSAEDP